MKEFGPDVRVALEALGVKATATGLEAWTRKHGATMTLVPNGTDAPSPYVVALLDGDGATVGAGWGVALLDAWSAAVADASERGID